MPWFGPSYPYPKLNHPSKFPFWKYFCWKAGDNNGHLQILLCSKHVVSSSSSVRDRRFFFLSLALFGCFVLSKNIFPKAEKKTFCGDQSSVMCHDMFSFRPRAQIYVAQMKFETGKEASPLLESLAWTAINQNLVWSFFFTWWIGFDPKWTLRYRA